jgi:solute carrier family 13 (sodium-dependent dicarboxylate transporter), member 2/3/5
MQENTTVADRILEAPPLERPPHDVEVLHTRETALAGAPGHAGPRSATALLRARVGFMAA